MMATMHGCVCGAGRSCSKSYSYQKWCPLSALDVIDVLNATCSVDGNGDLFRFYVDDLVYRAGLARNRPENADRPSVSIDCAR